MRNDNRTSDRTVDSESSFKNKVEFISVNRLDLQTLPIQETDIMKKFFAAIVMVCLIGAFSNQAMAQGPRDNGRPGQKPAAVNHQLAPGNHVGAVPGNHPAAQPAPPPRHAKPLPPPHQHHGKPLPPPPHHAKPVPPPPHHARPLPPPEPVPPTPRPIIDYRPGVGLYIGGEHFGFTISL